MFTSSVLIIDTYIGCYHAEGGYWREEFEQVLIMYIYLLLAMNFPGTLALLHKQS